MPQVKHILTIGLFIFCGLNTYSQCHIHPNFRSIANMGGLNAIYEIQLTLVGTRTNGQQYTARGAAEICNTSLQNDCAKEVNIDVLVSDGTSASCSIYINFVENSLLKKQDNLKTNYRNIQRKGKSYYATASDGTILTFSFIKRVICLK